MIRIKGKRVLAPLLALLVVITSVTVLPVPAVASSGEFQTSIESNGITITGYNGSGGDIIIPSQINGLPVVAIGVQAFRGNTSITGVTIPDSVSDIESGAFYDCKNLASVTFGNGVKAIGNHAFWGCENLTNITIPNGVVSIGREVFWGCTKLSVIILPDTISSIGEWVFGPEMNTHFPGGMIINMLREDAIVYVPNENIKRLAENKGAKNIIVGGAYAATFETNGGRPINSIYAVRGQNINRPLSPKRSGYSFAGWYRDSSLTSEWDFENDVLTGNITLYAKWDTIARPSAGLFLNPVSAVQNTGNNVGYVDYWYRVSYGDVPSVMTVVNEDGSVSVLNAAIESDYVYIYEYTHDLQYIRTVSIAKEMPKVGAFTKDYRGNYYVFFGKDVEENAHDEINMVLVQYDSEGRRQKAYEQKAYPTESFSGIRRPFSSGSCRIEISGNMIAVHFARLMFQSGDGLNHQASYGFVLNLDTFEEITRGTAMVYVSHSFNQFILPIDGGFVLADHGDAHPRAFNFTKTSFALSANRYTVSAFEFIGETGQNATFAQMGGLVKTSDGFIFAGTYERDRVTAQAIAGAARSRNLFIVKFDDNMTLCSNPTWITNYTDVETQNAANPKIVELDAGRYILMWERTVGENSGTEQATRTTYYTIIDEHGNTLIPTTELPDVRLSFNDVLRYNPITGYVHWAVGSHYTGDEDVITLYAFNPDLPLSSSSASTWAHDGITAAIEKGFVPTDLQGNYTAVITRAEFCRMAVKWVEYATGKNIDTILAERGLSRRQNAFSDTADPDILAAYALGITSGTTAPTDTAPGMFSPNGQFTREQAATMIMNTCYVIGADVSNPPLSDFSDLNTASSWARKGINFVRANGIMQGTSVNPPTFSPMTPYTREQSIVTFNNIRHNELVSLP